MARGGAAGVGGAKPPPPPPHQAAGATNAAGQNKPTRQGAGDIADPKHKPDTGSFRNELIKQGKGGAAGVVVGGIASLASGVVDRAVAAILPKPPPSTPEIR